MRRGSAIEVNSKEADTENMKGFFMRKESETFDENQTIRKNERFHYRNEKHWMKIRRSEKILRTRESGCHPVSHTIGISCHWLFIQRERLSLDIISSLKSD